MSDPRHLLGRRGETLACDWLIARGWTILARRWRSPEGELDIVARDPDGILVAVEVKLRRGSRTGAAIEAVDRGRVRRLRAALGQFRPVGGAAEGGGLRIDLVTVTEAAEGGWRLTHHPAIDGW